MPQGSSFTQSTWPSDSSPAGTGQGHRPRVSEGDGRGLEPEPREGAERPADVQEHPVEDGKGEGTDGGGAAAREEEDRGAAGGEGQGRGRGRWRRHFGGRERLSLCSAPRLESTQATHAPHEAPKTAARNVAPQAKGQIFPLGVAY